MKLFSTLKNTLTFYFICVAILPIMLIDFFGFRHLVVNMESEITGKNEALAESLSRELSQQLNGALKLLILIRDTTENQVLVSNNNVSDYLELLVTEYGYIDMLKVLDNDGTLTHMAPYDENLFGLDMSSQDYFSHAIGSTTPHWSETFISPQTGLPTLTLTIPKKSGYIVGHINLAGLATITDNVKHSISGYAIVADTSGVTIAHPISTFVSERLSILSLPIVQQGLAHNEGTYRFSFQGIEKIGSVAIISPTNWIVAVIQPVEVAFAPIGRMKKFVVLISLVALVLAVVVALYNLRKILKPLDRLAEDSHRVSRGDSVYKEKESSYSEIDSLNSSFDVMVKTVMKRELSLQNEIDFRKQTEKDLRESETRFKTLIDKSPLPMVVTDQNQDIVFLNEKFRELFGYTREDVSTAEKWWEAAYPDLEYRQKVQESWMVAIGDALENNTDIAMQEWELTIKDRSSRRCEFFMVPLDEVSLIIMNDISERKQAEVEKGALEARLQQAQKMEAIGTLAGGIAHDFNNILSVILGYTEIARDDSDPESTVVQDLNMVLEAGHRARDLVQQILSFSRQSGMKRSSLNITILVDEAIKMLRPTLPSTIEITQVIENKISHVFADPTQLNQVIINLCTNAFHAMEETGGELSISLKEVTLDSEDLVHQVDITSGLFVQLSVSDSGTGIPPELEGKIFEPYFTTKETGKGTGMGLAITHGIIKDCGGFVTVHSVVGKGATFQIFLPVFDNEKPLNETTSEPAPIGKERILFIDDEELLVKVGKSMLERLGYHVTALQNSVEALTLFENHPDQFDLVITDQTMPGMTGENIARRMIQIRPEIPIILCTGYSTVFSEEDAKSMGIKEFSFKPLAKKDIAKLIRKVLDVS